ncbi:benzoylformate decarboxylase [Thermoplasma volcanium GSS1]|uniref:Benzoylformate decarboxylase n=1 Tax=Thermoplasma volcanium (strain ATCC 51530 / DSM 4299 / JCM 9571 / NBRC 15438 / GSS1) TaxID=273116 RepID=Q97AL2_THEVO|nr:thiamine pyrophosphate-binding protein [Thermoplasma volcanium]BAB59940.1 benzoylformate decarboxylase [Thermoplasma volcanium GSS1]
MKASEIFAKTLEEHELYPVYGNPGTTEIPMLSFVKDYRLTLHDSISVAMADAVSQYSGRPAVVNLHSLPGISNSMAFIYSAFKNNSPIIITAGQQDRRHLIYDPLLSGDQVDMVSPYVKYAYEVRMPSEIPEAMKRAYEIAMTPPYGPVFLSFPMDLMDEDAEYHSSEFYSTPGIAIDEDIVKSIMDRVNSARKVAIVYGYEVDLYGAMDLAREFSTKLNVPVFSEPWSQGSCCYRDQNFVRDLPPAMAAIDAILSTFDLVLFIGSDIFVYPYTPAEALRNVEAYFISTRPTHFAGHSIISDPRSFLSVALKYAKKKENYKIAMGGGNEVAEEEIKMIHDYFKGYTAIDEAVTASGAVRKYFADGPKSYYTSRGGPLGWGDAATVGISALQERTLGIIGDGAFMYTVQSLWTASRYGMPSKFVVLRNNAYNILRSYSKAFGYGIEDADFLKLEYDPVKVSEGLGVEARVYASIDDIKWLKEEKKAKVLVIDTDQRIPEMF